MGNISEILQKSIKCVRDCQAPKVSEFDQEESMEYSQELKQKCFQHVIDLNASSFDSLKRLHKYLHPALHRLDDLSKADPENILRINEEDIISSSGSVMKMYLNYLKKVVPANISYFHFMRQKDFYIHLIAMRYCLKAGLINKSYLRGSHIFADIRPQIKTLLLDLLSHWLYDMVKYYCSAILIQSFTLPHLIDILAFTLCALIQEEKSNIFQNYETQQRKQIYERTLYSLTFILCKANKFNQIDKIQLVLAGMNQLFTHFHQTANKLFQTAYAPSNWFVGEVGFIKEPCLERICFVVVLDILGRKERQIKIQHKNQRRRKQKHILKKKNGDKYEQFIDEDILPQESQQSQVYSESGLFEDKKNQEEVQISKTNLLTSLHAYKFLVSAVQFLPVLLQEPSFTKFINQQCHQIVEQSLIRPFLIRLINTALQYQGTIEISDILYTRPGWIQPLKDKKKRKKNPFIVQSALKQYHKTKQSDYVINNIVAPCNVVGENIKILLKKNILELLNNFNIQMNKSEGELWSEVLKHNRHQLRALQKKQQTDI